MKKILQQNLFFLIPYFLFLLVAGIFLAIYSKGEAHLIVNQFSFEFCDYFFYYITYIGDGIAVMLIIFLLCLVKFRYAVFTAMSNIVSALITQTLKRTLFDNIDRPIKFFEGGAHLKLVPWVDNYIYNSFPSGHTTAAFTTFFCFSLIVKSKPLKFLMLLFALMIGFSRVYLSQHFLNDVYAGSVIGVSVSFCVYYFMERMGHIHWMEKSILNYK
ncbi:MAG: phosphatase PAP2 family protein [Bacteroidetes bacterium]|nr:phosphatase PAP2 family protein [Bacteroidota bacterium]